MTFQFLLNRNSVEENVPANELLLDIIRCNRGLTGTKEACREGDCGACQILVGKLMNDRIRYQAVNACLLPAGAISGRHVVTIEGLNSSNSVRFSARWLKTALYNADFARPAWSWR